MLGEGVSTHVPTRVPTWHQPLRAPSQLRPAVSAPSPVSHRSESGSPFWEAPLARAEDPNLTLTLTLTLTSSLAKEAVTVGAHKGWLALRRAHAAPDTDA